MMQSRSDGADAATRKLELGLFEKSVLAGAGVFALWMASTVYTNSVRLSVIDAKLDAIKEVSADRYTSTQAAADHNVRDAQINALSDRIKVLERRHNMRANNDTP